MRTWDQSSGSQMAIATQDEFFMASPPFKTVQDADSGLSRFSNVATSCSVLGWLQIEGDQRPGLDRPVLGIRQLSRPACRIRVLCSE